MRILWIAAVWPEPTSSAAGYRTAQLISALTTAGHELHVSSPCSDNPHRAILESQGVATAHHPMNDPSFDPYVRALDPAVVIFDRFMTEEQFGWRVRSECPAAIRVLDTVDLHSLRRTRAELLKHGGDPNLLTPEVLSSEDAKREIASIYRSDLSLIISDFEYRLLTEHYKVPPELLQLCRFAYPDPTPGLPFESRKDLVVIGNFNHPPNSDSVRLLHSTLWSPISALLGPQVELHIYGSYPKREISSLDNPATGFRVRGWTEDSVQTLGKYRLNLAPLRFGAGIKGKIADGWSVGTPCVTTSIGAEGMYEKEEFGGAIADTLEAFAQTVGELYSNKKQWEDGSNAGMNIIRKLYSSNIYPPVINRFEELVTDRKNHRANNLIGEILWGQQHRSTEYFSRWIEAKNGTKERL